MRRTFYVAALLLMSLGCGGEEGGMLVPDATILDIDAQPIPDARPLKAHGEACGANAECLSRWCYLDVCATECDIDIAYDCRDTGGFCVGEFYDSNQNPLNLWLCSGDFHPGSDQDEAILLVGDSVTRFLTPLADKDLFQLRVAGVGDYALDVTPLVGIDIELAVYTNYGSPIGIIDSFGPGGAEGGILTVSDPDGSTVFVVVRNVGNTTGNYTVSLAAN